MHIVNILLKIGPHKAYLKSITHHKINDIIIMWWYQCKAMSKGHFFTYFFMSKLGEDGNVSIKMETILRSPVKIFSTLFRNVYQYRTWVLCQTAVEKEPYVLCCVSYEWKTKRGVKKLLKSGHLICIVFLMSIWTKIHVKELLKKKNNLLLMSI